MGTTLVDPADVRTPDRPTEIPLTLISKSPFNHRKRFREASLQEMAETIKDPRVGILQPLIVRPVEGHLLKSVAPYELVCGERRYRSAWLAFPDGDFLAPCIVRELTDADVIYIQAIENIQREDVLPLEEASAYQDLINLGTYDVASIAAKVGKPQDYVLGRLRLLKLIPAVAGALDDGILPIGHALLIAKLEPEDQPEALSAAGIEHRGPGEYGVAYGGIKTIKQFKQWFQNSLVLDMGSAVWDLDDATLNPERGACSTCLLRTSNNGILFSEFADGDRCTNRRCWNLKLNEHMERKRRELEAQGPVITISTSWSSPSVKDALPARAYDAVPTSSDALRDAQEAKDEDLQCWLVDLSDESEDEEPAKLAPATFDEAVEMIRRDAARNMEEPYCSDFLASFNDLVAGGYFEFNDEAFKKDDAGIEWPELNRPLDLSEAAVPENAVMALVVDGPEKGAVKPVVLKPEVAAKVADPEAVAEKEREARLARKEELRLQRAEVIARKGIFDAVLAAIEATPDDDLLALAQRLAPRLIPIAAVKIGNSQHGSVYDSDDPKEARHPGRSDAIRMLGLHRGGPTEGYGDARAFDRTFKHCFAALFVGLTYDEIHVGPQNPVGQPGLALFDFASYFDINVPEIRKEAEWSTLSKAQKAARAKSEQPAERSEPARIVTPLDRLRPGAVVVTSYGSGPYEILSVSKAVDQHGKVASVTCRNLGSTSQSVDGYLNYIRELPDGGLGINGDDRIYLLDIVLPPVPDSESVSNYQIDNILFFAPKDRFNYKGELHIVLEVKFAARKHPEPSPIVLYTASSDPLRGNVVVCYRDPVAWPARDAEGNPLEQLTSRGRTMIPREEIHAELDSMEEEPETAAPATSEPEDFFAVLRSARHIVKLPGEPNDERWIAVKQPELLAGIARTNASETICGVTQPGTASCLFEIDGALYVCTSRTELYGPLTMTRVYRPEAWSLPTRYEMVFGTYAGVEFACHGERFVCGPAGENVELMYVINPPAEEAPIEEAPDPLAPKSHKRSKSKAVTPEA